MTPQFQQPSNNNSADQQSIISHSSPGKPSKILDSQTNQRQFQKNYPKNIFISIIEYLYEKGFKDMCEQTVGSKSSYESKNVVPLITLHLLISQDWFINNISNEELVSYISNKIFTNSKIKKKLFHLLIVHKMFSQSVVDAKNFKKKISKYASQISKRRDTPHEVFSYTNSIIYLLNIFLKILLYHSDKKGLIKLEEQMCKMSIQDEVSEQKTKNNTVRQQYKGLVKDIVHIMSSKSIGKDSFSDIFEQIKQNISQKTKQIRQRYSFNASIPNWQLFVQIVVGRSFQFKLKNIKITNFLINQWISQYKNKTSPKQKQQNNEISQFKQELINYDGNQNKIKQDFSNESKESEKQNKIKKFTPIILSMPQRK